MNHPFEGANKAKSIWYRTDTGCICPKPSRSEVFQFPTRYLHFDSIGEYTLWHRLVICPSVAFVDLHYQQELLPATESEAAIYWNIDFRIGLKDMTKPIILVEFKGNYIRQSSFNRDALLLRYRLLKRNMPKQAQFYVVTEGTPYNLCKEFSTITTQQLLTILGQ